MLGGVSNLIQKLLFLYLYSNLVTLLEGFKAAAAASLPVAALSHGPSLGH